MATEDDGRLSQELRAPAGPGQRWEHHLGCGGHYYRPTGQHWWCTLAGGLKKRIPAAGAGSVQWLQLQGLVPREAVALRKNRGGQAAPCRDS
ncbi:hypothetical protein NDU88_007281 [Pleurodeles waltl]|uniref:Uncharacterized protein n=1 Tax=Pleurodeles waltl TaxID=8319 RepID=A0AAV7RRA9_PLEWA|nr:hypothetical protein NDU88_007281 [Pleurodeles waltl]